MGGNLSLKRLDKSSADKNGNASTAKSKVTLEDFDDVNYYAQMLADVKCTADWKWRTSQ